MAQCLNPFDIRASVRTMALSASTPSWVSIPLISGHQSGQSSRGGIFGSICLNPFDIRASVRTDDECKRMPQRFRLNPFDIRASVRTVPPRFVRVWSHVSIPLISGHQSGQPRKTRFQVILSLNPFDIRASVRTGADDALVRPSESQSL